MKSFSFIFYLLVVACLSCNKEADLDEMVLVKEPPKSIAEINKDKVLSAAQIQRQKALARFIRTSIKGPTPGAIPLNIPDPPAYPQLTGYAEDSFIKSMEMCRLNLSFLGKFEKILEKKRQKLLMDSNKQAVNLSNLDKIQAKIIMLKDATQELEDTLKHCYQVVQNTSLSEAEKNKWVGRFDAEVITRNLMTFPGPVEISTNFKDRLVWQRNHMETITKGLHEVKVLFEAYIASLAQNKGKNPETQNENPRTSQILNWGKPPLEIISDLYETNASSLRQAQAFMDSMLSKESPKVKQELKEYFSNASNQNHKLKPQLEEMQSFFKEKSFLTQEQKDKYLIVLRKKLIIFSHLFDQTQDFLLLSITKIEPKEQKKIKNQCLKIEGNLALLTQSLDEITLKLKKIQTTGEEEEEERPEFYEAH